MHRRGLIIFLLVSAALLSASGAALAGTYTWSQPTDFTGNANPEQKYGAPSWSYYGGSTLMTCSSGTCNSSGIGMISKSGNALQMVPAAGGDSVALAWTSPFATSQQVSVSGTVTPPGGTPTGGCGYSWTLTDGTTPVQSGTSSTTGQISATPTVAPGAQLKLTVTANAANYSAACDTASVTLAISATNAAPAPTITSPANGAAIGQGQPTFSGTASTGFGEQNTITVDVYQGSSASGTPYETLTTAASSGTWSVAPSPALPDGTYTVQASQTDQGGATGKSAPVTFTLKTHPPHVTLDQPQSGANIRNQQPTFSGQAGSSPGDSPDVVLTLYQGNGTLGPVVGSYTVPRDGSSWSFTWPKQLAPALYTAQASQSDDAGHVARSSANVFLIVSPSAPTQAIGHAVHILHHRVSLKVLCSLSASQRCTGDVLILTTRNFRPNGGSPRGQLQLMFAYVSIRGGHTATVSRRLPHLVLATLERARKHGHKHLRAQVSATLAENGVEQSFLALRPLKGLP